MLGFLSPSTIRSALQPFKQNITFSVPTISEKSPPSFGLRKTTQDLTVSTGTGLRTPPGTLLYAGRFLQGCFFHSRQ